GGNGRRSLGGGPGDDVGAGGGLRPGVGAHRAAQSPPGWTPRNGKRILAVATQRAKGDGVASADVVIVGGGVNGASTAFHLAQAGVKRVVVCEQRHLGAGASGKSGALVRTHYTNEPETRLAFESHRYFANWGELVGGDCGFQRVGLIVIAPRAYQHHLEANVAMHRRVGVDARLITAADARALDPSLSV